MYFQGQKSRCSPFDCLIKQLLLATFSCLVLTFGGPQSAESQAPEEYAVKAAFVYNFTQLTQWPKSAFKGKSQPFNIAVFGSDHVKTLFQSIDGKTSADRTIRIFTPEPDALDLETELSQCQIVFISSQMDAEKVSRIINATENRPILTIGEEKNFSRRGGIIQFIKKNDRLHFEVNLKNAQAHDIKFSSRLLKLAVIVSEEK